LVKLVLSICIFEAGIGLLTQYMRFETAFSDYASFGEATVPSLTWALYRESPVLGFVAGQSTILPIVAVVLSPRSFLRRITRLSFWCICFQILLASNTAYVIAAYHASWLVAAKPLFTPSLAPIAAQSSFVSKVLFLPLFQWMLQGGGAVYALLIYCAIWTVVAAALGYCITGLWSRVGQRAEPA
jgi:hypothetical protein